MASHVIQVPQADGQVVVTVPGVRRVVLEVVDGKITAHDDDIADAVLASVDGAVRLEETASFDPAEHTVAEVNDYLDRHPDQAERVLAAEADEDTGRARRGVLAGPHAPAAEDEPQPEDSEEQ